MAAYAALVSVMHIIHNLQRHPRSPISLHIKQVESLTQKFTFLQEFLESYNPQLPYSTEADPLESRIVDAAHAAEDVIESYIVDQINNGGKNMSFDDLYEAVEKVIEEMMLIETEAMEIKLQLTQNQLHIKSTPLDSMRSASIKQKNSMVGADHVLLQMKDMELIQKEAVEIMDTVGVVQQQLHTKSTPSDSMRTSSSIAQKKNSMVGADDLLLQMKDKLTSDRRELQIIPIVGMGGSGKTTLAINIYQDPLIKEHFHICAWVTISQEYSIREMLIEILGQLNQNVGQNLSEDELGEILYRHLFGRKYLIVMDDMWSIEAWAGVKRFLPDSKNGSRIVVTTRLSNLAAELPNSNSLEMTLLDEDDSWELLSKTVFGEENCPLELEEVGKKIGKSCKGLPLSITVVGGLLAKSKHTREFWESIEENLNSIVNLDDDERCLKLLYMSYKQLPIHLKPCFLYMGVFPEDEVIRASKLVQLWVAEGFLKLLSGKTLEETAELYLKDLIDRNLILGHELGSIGNIKYCKMHDLLRDLCLREAEKERFYTVAPQGIANAGQRCIVISKDEDINALSSMSELVRSLSLNLDVQVLPLLSVRFLRILNTRRLGNTYESLKSLESLELVNSRFLQTLTDPNFKLSRSVGLSWNLQTLIIHNSRGIDIDIWHMSHIRHVQVDWVRLSDPPNDQDDIVLENLQTLGRIMNFKCSQQVVMRIPNIKKLKMVEMGSSDHLNCLQNLARLDKLESLACDFYRLWPHDSLCSLINFPHSLKKLALDSGPGMLDKIGALPFLQKLKLVRGCFEDNKWETSEGQFPSLKFLCLDECVLQVWTTESSHFPCLEQLLLHKMADLKEIPLEFAEASALRVIDVRRCSDSAIESAKRILEEQEELYGEEAALQVRVKLWRRNNQLLKSSATPNFRVS